MAFVSPLGYQPIYNPDVPLKHLIYSCLCPGMSVYIQGRIPPDAKSFCVDFLCCTHDGADIAFHFNVLFDGNVVCNTFQSGLWGGEEKKNDGFPFRRGENFELVFFISPRSFEVTVNGSLFCEFSYRMPPGRVQGIKVSGDVIIQSLTIVGRCVDSVINPALLQGGAMALPAMGEPNYNPPVPYSAKIPGGVTPKRTFVIRGFMPEGGQSFHINFVTVNGDIALHFNVHLKEHKVVRNSKLGGSWGHEERGMANNPFVPGQYFDLSIRTGNDRYKIYANGQPFCEYAHRFPDLQMINTLEIGGNVVLSLVQF